MSFSMASPLQREAWDILSSVPPGQRIDAVCHAICRAHEETTMLDALRAVLREELGGSGCISATEKCAQPQEAGNVGDDVLGFLLDLQGDDETAPVT